MVFPDLPLLKFCEVCRVEHGIGFNFTCHAKYILRDKLVMYAVKPIVVVIGSIEDDPFSDTSVVSVYSILYYEVLTDRLFI